MKSWDKYILTWTKIGLDKGVHYNEHILTCIDLLTGNICYSTPIAAATYDCYIMGEMLGMYSEGLAYNTLEIYSALSVEPKKIKLSENAFYTPHLAFKNDCMLYQTKEEIDKYHKRYTLICFDFLHDKQVWELELPESIEGEPIISSDGAMAYIVTKNEVVAIHMNLPFEGMKRILWRALIKHDRQFRIKLSSDNKILYGLDVDWGNLFTFDCQSGAKTEIGVFREGRVTHLLEVLKDKVYLQGLHF